MSSNPQRKTGNISKKHKRIVTKLKQKKRDQEKEAEFKSFEKLIKSKNKGEETSISKSSTKKKKVSSTGLKLRNFLSDDTVAEDDEISVSMDNVSVTSGNKADSEIEDEDELKVKTKTERKKTFKFVKTDIISKQKNVFPILFIDQVGFQPNLFIQNYSEAKLIQDLDLYPGFAFEKPKLGNCCYCNKEILEQTDQVVFYEDFNIHKMCLQFLN